MEADPSNLVRLNSDGSVDYGFVGFAANPPGEGSGRGSGSLAIQSDGKILLTTNYSVERFNVNGRPDVTFGGNGSVELAPQGYFKVALQPNGRILVVGTVVSGANPQLEVFRLNTNGTLDTTFGVGGTVTSSLDTGTTPNTFAIEVQPDDRMVVAEENNAESVLIRYNPNGSVDTTFGVNGLVITSSGSIVADLALQTDGKIVTVGSIVAGPGSTAFAITRYTADTAISDPNQRFLSQVYLDLLQRPIDPSGLAAWSSELAAGVTRSQVVAAIETSVEYHTLEVEYLYGFLLNRQADPGGLAGWVYFLNQVGTHEQLEAQFLGPTSILLAAAGAPMPGICRPCTAIRSSERLTVPVPNPGASSWPMAARLAPSPRTSWRAWNRIPTKCKHSTIGCSAEAPMAAA